MTADGYIIITRHLALVYTWIIKRFSNRSMYFSKNSKTQTDYFLRRRRHFLTDIPNNTVPYKTILSLPWPLIGVFRANFHRRIFSSSTSTRTTNILNNSTCQRHRSWSRKLINSEKAIGPNEHHSIGKKGRPFQYRKRKSVRQNIQIIARFDCYRTMKIFVHIRDTCIHNIFQVTLNQVRFVKNCGTTNEIHRVWFEETPSSLHCVFGFSKGV